MYSSKYLKGYCAKCKHRDTCTVPCAPVEALLESVTGSEGERLSKEFKDHVKNTIGHWYGSSKTKKQQIIELYFLGNRRQRDIVYLVSSHKQYVSLVVRAEKERRRK